MARRLLDRLCELHPDLPREKLLSRVLCGDVFVDGERVRDPGRHVDPAASLEIADAEAEFVSRGGHKLDHALEVWAVDVTGIVALDAGASTGGFTDCLLRRGARAVHAVDVGYNQLDYRLRRDRRVVVHERTNIMHVERLDPHPEMAVADLSFRSLRGAAAHVLGLTSRGEGIFLVKPQFEWESPPAEFTGTVPDDALEQILTGVIRGLRTDGVEPLALIESPIRGRSGNREFLLRARWPAADVDREGTPVEQVVRAALGRTTS